MGHRPGAARSGLARADPRVSRGSASGGRGAIWPLARGHRGVGGFFWKLRRTNPVFVYRDPFHPMTQDQDNITAMFQTTVPFLIVENIIGIAGNRRRRDRRSGIAVQHDQSCGRSTPEEKTVVGFVERCHGEISRRTARLPSRHHSALRPVDHGDVMRGGHVLKIRRPRFSSTNASGCPDNSTELICFVLSPSITARPFP